MPVDTIALTDRSRFCATVRSELKSIGFILAALAPPLPLDSLLDSDLDSPSLSPPPDELSSLLEDEELSEELLDSVELDVDDEDELLLAAGAAAGGAGGGTAAALATTELAVLAATCVAVVAAWFVEHGLRELHSM
jgi:hypothetical protein